MNRRLLLALLLAAGCSRPIAKPAAAYKDPNKLPADVVNERSSLLDVSRGATIVSRTAEATLNNSAMSMVDGEIATFWTPPPHDYPQSIVIALAAPSRIDRLGVRSLTGGAGYEANHLMFERSIDGVAWQPLAAMTSRRVSEGQWLDVAPSEAAYLRVTVPDSLNADRDARIQSLFARGTELSAPRNAPIDGCWSINGSEAIFSQRGTRATGVVAQGKQPIDLAGGTNGRIWRFNWIRGNDYGYTALTVSPDGKHLSALNWHEEAIPLFTALPWFGERRNCAPSVTIDVPIALLHRAGRVSMFALQFDENGNLLADASREELQTMASIIRGVPVPLRIVAHEYRQPDAIRNRQVAEREIATVRQALAQLDLSRVEFIAAGSDAPRQVPASDAARAIYSSVDVEVRR